jgi:exodeoxyribonuclease V alpha subunit
VQTVAGQSLAAAWLVSDPAPVLAQQTVMLRQSRRFKGAIGQLALAVNRGEASAARAVVTEDFVGTRPRSRTGVHGATDEPQALLALQASTPETICALALGTSGKPSYVDYLKLVQTGPAGRSAKGDAQEKGNEGEDGFGDIHARWVRSVLKAFERFRILCAVHQGDWGTQGLNAAVQKALAEQGLIQAQGDWFAGRPVMVTRNDTQLGVFNGDVGLVLPNTEGKLKVWFLDGDALRSVSVMRLAQVETAFVMTVHKSQGSEFEHTALVLPPGGAGVLSRELVYTGITRAREQFTLIEAEAGLLEAAIHRPSLRASGLSRWWA